MAILQYAILTQYHVLVYYATVSRLLHRQSQRISLGAKLPCRNGAGWVKDGYNMDNGIGPLLCHTSWHARVLRAGASERQGM